MGKAQHDHRRGQSFDRALVDRDLAVLEQVAAADDDSIRQTVHVVDLPGGQAAIGAAGHRGNVDDAEVIAEGLVQ